MRIPATSCTRYASPTGSDSGGRGTLQSPYRTVQALVDSLQPGETGCLEGGVYREDVSIHRGGTRGRRITLTSAPGARAVVQGVLWVAGGANFVTVSNLRLDGRNGAGVPSPQVNADYTLFYGDDVTNDHTGICFVLGGSAGTYGVASHTTIARSRIHGCGTLPATHLDHGIYLEHTRGTEILDNYIYDNADWALHLFPDAQDSNIQYNVVDGNGDGLIIAGTGGMASSGNYVAHNIFSNTTDRGDSVKPTGNYGYLVTSFWGNRVGRDNVVTDNCFWNGVAGDVNTANGGFSLSENRVADPGYLFRAGDDFRLRSGSPCAGDGPRGQ